MKNSQLEKIEAEMTDIMKFNDSVIMTIPGIGYINGGMILIIPELSEPPVRTLGATIPENESHIFR